MKNKAEIRNEIYGLRKKQAPGMIRQNSRIISGKLKSLELFDKAENIFCYLSTEEEVGTDDIIVECRNAGKTVFVPVTDRSGYGIAELTGESVIVTGRFNIREPINTEIIKGVLPKDTLSLVPGVAFGRDCGRIGYGGGYYDRLFLRYGLLAGFKIGLGFEFQIYESVPFEQHDIFLDMVITEQSVYQR